MGSAVLLTFVIPTRARHTVGPQRGMGSMISMAVKLDNGMSPSSCALSEKTKKTPPKKSLGQKNKKMPL
jgi:hypothetical protein